MSDSLLDLFNSPQSSRPPPPPRSRSPSYSPTGPPPRAGPSSPQDALFLSPGSATDTPARRRARAASFDDLDPEEDLSATRPPKRAAVSFDADFGANQDPAAPAAPGGVYVLNDGLGDPLDPFAALHQPDAGEKEGEGKKKRVMPKIDGDRLMGPNGFPALIKAAKRFKSRGKGHEKQDLKDLMNVYQIWAHNMFPKGDFYGTVTRVEKVCKTRRMESALKGYRDAFYPPSEPEPRSRSVSPVQRGISPVRDSSPDQDAEGLLPRQDSEPSLAHDSPANGDADEPDMDEIMAMEEMERQAATHAASAQRAALDDAPPDLQEEDEWEGLYD